MEAFASTRGRGGGFSIEGCGVAGCGLPVWRGVERSVSEKQKGKPNGCGEFQTEEANGVVLLFW